jgi:hypothetical protein
MKTGFMKTAWLAIALIGLIQSPVMAQCQKQKLVAAEAQPSEEMGLAVAISGDWAAAGAPYTQDATGATGGVVYVFHRVRGAWIETQQLVASDSIASALFGSSLAMDDKTLVIGASGDSTQGFSFVGSVYVFNLVGSTWIQTAKLNPTVMHSGDAFGDPVSISTNRILIGAGYDDSHGLDSGAA